MDSATEANAGSLDVISDAICPWCWIGKRHLDTALGMLAEEGFFFNVRFRPFQLNPEMPAEGVDRREYRSAKFGSLEKIPGIGPPRSRCRARRWARVSP